MKQGIYSIIGNKKIAEGIYKMTLEGDTSSITRPGQFVEIKLDGFFLRRPISICDWDDDTLTLIYRIVGEGTNSMKDMEKRTRLDLLCGLGNGYDTDKSGQEPLLIGGGVGIPPLYGLCKRLKRSGKNPSVILGFNNKNEIFLADEFAQLGCEVYVTTADGSYGKKGFVTDVMKDRKYSFFYTCGPMAMYRAMEKIACTSGQYSMEERMGCGFGACMGCTCKTKSGNKRVCKDGPVFDREEIIWESQE